MHQRVDLRLFLTELRGARCPQRHHSRTGRDLTVCCPQNRPNRTWAGKGRGTCSPASCFGPFASAGASRPRGRRSLARSCVSPQLRLPLLKGEAAGRTPPPGQGRGSLPDPRTGSGHRLPPMGGAAPCTRFLIPLTRWDLEHSAHCLRACFPIREMGEHKSIYFN